MTPAARFRMFRDFVILSVASFMLVYETVAVTQPNALIVGAGASLLGLPVAFRLDQAFSNGNGGNGANTERRR